MSATDYKLPEEYTHLIEVMVGKARQNLERYGELTSVCFLTDRVSKKLTIVGIPRINRDETVPVAEQIRLEELQKDMVVLMLQEEARQIGADFSMTAFEAWGHKEGVDAQKELEKYGSVSRSPNRIDVVYFTIQCAEDRLMGIAEVTRINKRKRTFGEVKWSSEKHDQKEIMSRFFFDMGGKG